MILQKLIFISALFLSCHIFGAAQDITMQDVKTKIPGNPNITFFDLVKRVFPDARIDETERGVVHAETKITLRKLFFQPPEKGYRGEMDGRLKISLSQMQETVDGHQKLLWLMIDAVQENGDHCQNSILAVFSIHRHEAEFLDGADIKIHDFTSFNDENMPPDHYQKMLIGPRRQAVIIYNRTGVTSGTDTYSLVGINQTGFNVLINGFDLQKDGRCGNFIQEKARIRLLKNSVAGYRSLEIIVTTEKGQGDEAPYVVNWRRHYRYVFNWQPKEQSYQAVINPDKARLAVHKNYDPCAGFH